MIDIHTHVIPAVDDGPPDMETSLAMAAIAAAEGIETIIATSHSEECARIGAAGMKARLDAVRAAWTSAGHNIRLEPGVEIYLTPGTAEDLRTGRLWPLAGSRYVLVELPYEPWPHYAEQALFDLQTAGYIPILAHPERYTAIQDRPALMYTLAERGVLAQVTARALTSRHSTVARRCAETLVRHNLVQFISSDSHGTTARKRTPSLREAVAAAELIAGPEMAHAMVTTNPAAILEDRPITPVPRPMEKDRSILERLFGG
jgi:protein-tyrosine phosphatase